MKLAKNIISIGIGLFSLVVMSDAVAEKMAMPTLVTTAEILKYYKTIQKKRKLTNNESGVVQFIQVAHDVFKIDDFVVDGYYQDNDKEKHLSAQSIAKAIQRTLKQKKNWDEPVSAADMARINFVESAIKTNLGADSYATAWLNYKNGNKAEAKTILNHGFDQAFDGAMKMENIGFSDDGNPIQDAEFFSQALIPLSNEKENKARTEKLQKAKIRASNLPHIMT